MDPPFRVTFIPSYDIFTLDRYMTLTKYQYEGSSLSKLYNNYVTLTSRFILSLIKNIINHFKKFHSYDEKQNMNKKYINENYTFI